MTKDSKCFDLKNSRNENTELHFHGVHGASGWLSGDVRPSQGWKDFNLNLYLTWEQVLNLYAQLQSLMIPEQAAQATQYDPEPVVSQAAQATQDDPEPVIFRIH